MVTNSKEYWSLLNYYKGKLVQTNETLSNFKISVGKIMKNRKEKVCDLMKKKHEYAHLNKWIKENMSNIILRDLTEIKIGGY
jgi:hypothetical protein